MTHEISAEIPGGAATQSVKNVTVGAPRKPGFGAPKLCCLEAQRVGELVSRCCGVLVYLNTEFTNPETDANSGIDASSVLNKSISEVLTSRWLTLSTPLV